MHTQAVSFVRVTQLKDHLSATRQSPEDPYAACLTRPGRFGRYSKIGLEIYNEVTGVAIAVNVILLWILAPLMRPMLAAYAPCSQLLLFRWRHIASDEIALCLRRQVGRSCEAPNFYLVLGVRRLRGGNL